MIKRILTTTAAIRVSLALWTIFIALDAGFSVWPSPVVGQTRGPAVGLVTRPKPAGPYSESHALIIGISQYSNGWPDLPGVAADVVAVRKILEKHGFQIQEALNPNRQRFDQAVRDFIGQYGQKKDNRLVIYFAGHGHTLVSNDGKERRSGYLVPADAPAVKGDDVGPFKKLAISMGEIEQYAKEITSKHALFIFDSCFSGEFFKLRGGAVPDSISYKLEEPVRQFITAGTEKQSVPDKSVFRRRFVAGLEGDADTNCDGYVTGSELGEFLQNIVTDDTKRAQTPQYGKIRDPDLDRGDIVFTVENAAAKCTGQLRDEGAYWKGIENGNDPQLFHAYLAMYPNGAHRDTATLRLRQLEKDRPKQASPSESSSQQEGSWRTVSEESPIVHAASDWTPTSMRIERDQLVKITATGQVNLGSYGYGGPRGVSSTDALRPLADCPTGALIAKIQSQETRINSQLICVRSETEFTAGVSGELVFRVNESRISDNGGQFNVRVTVFKFMR